MISLCTFFRFIFLGMIAVGLSSWYLLNSLHHSSHIFSLISLLLVCSLLQVRVLSDFISVCSIMTISLTAANNIYYYGYTKKLSLYQCLFFFFGVLLAFLFDFDFFTYSVCEAVGGMYISSSSSDLCPSNFTFLYSFICFYFDSITYFPFISLCVYPFGRPLPDFLPYICSNVYVELLSSII